MIVEIGGFGGGGEECHHPYDREVAGMRLKLGKQPTDGIAERAAEHPAGDHAGPENAARIARSQRQRRGDNLRQGRQEHHSGGISTQVLVDGKLRPPVAGTDHRRTANPTNPVHTPPMAAAAQRGNGERTSPPGRKRPPCTRANIPHPTPSTAKRISAERVPELRHAFGQAKDRLEPRDCAYDRVADHRSNYSRHQRFHLKVLRVEDFRRDEGPGQRRLEDGGDARAEPRGQRHVAFMRA